MPVILAAQEAPQRSGGLQFEASLSKQFARTYLKKTHHMVKWLKV
jgi:hypothetical protein